MLEDSTPWRILCTFVIASVLSGVFLGWWATRPELQSLWFNNVEFWTVPTVKFWLLASALFFLNLAIPYLVAWLRNWLSFSAYRSIIGGALIASSLMSLWWIERLPALAQFLLFRFALVLVLTLALLVISQKWYWTIAILMLVGSLMTPLIASIPYAFAKSVPPEWFEVSKFFVSSVLLSGLFGYWLVKSSDQRQQRSQSHHQLRIRRGGAVEESHLS